MVWKSYKLLSRLRIYSTEMTNLSELIFCLWNATSLNNKIEEFGYFINNNNVDVAMVTETWLKPNSNINFVNYDVIRCNFLRIIAGGVAIIINTRIRYHLLPQINISGCDILLIKIQSEISSTVGVVYVSPNAHFQFDVLNDIIRDHSPIVLDGNFNAKRRSWNNFSSNTRGVQLYKYIQNNDISLIHSDTYSYKAPHKKASNIDIFLVKDVPFNNSCYTINDIKSLISIVEI